LATISRVTRKRIAAVAAVAVAFSVAAPATASAATIDWQPCAGLPAGAECARLEVPLDWGHPEGAKISLALARHRAADPARRLGSLVLNPGGPGGAGAKVVQFGANQLAPELRDRFDLVGFDPRGVGGSTPAITCSQPVFGPTQFPATQAEFDQLVAHNRAIGEDCLRNTGPLLEHVDTISVARDLEALRVALGDERLNFLGLSYGTLIGNIYANMYPKNVRAMVLDGPVDHTVGSVRMVADENAASEVALQHFFTWCEQETSCELHTDVRSTYAQFLRAAERGPLPAPGIPGGSTTGEVARQGVYAMLNVVSVRPTLATAIKQAVAGDASALAKAATNGPDSDEIPDNVRGLQAYTAITCHDFPSDISTFSQLRREIIRARWTAPDIDGHVEGWLVQAGCIGWPVRARDPWQRVPVRGTPPILVVAGTYDPATPYAWGVGLASQIKGSVLLTRSTDGHTGLLNDTCAVQREVEYLLNPTAPVGTCP
jgi:pimeloyl-ACP methyl ester carboxylesterase